MIFFTAFSVQVVHIPVKRELFIGIDVYFDVYDNAHAVFLIRFIIQLEVVIGVGREIPLRDIIIKLPRIAVLFIQGVRQLLV